MNLTHYKQLHLSCNTKFVSSCVCIIAWITNKNFRLHLNRNEMQDHDIYLILFAALIPDRE